ncbi:MAG: hypothetical protein HRU20_00065 [Pseudomonadales bacterium]|nr:hypothetical protein [Pseudomonadales bacterium]
MKICQHNHPFYTALCYCLLLLAFTHTQAQTGSMNDQPQKKKLSHIGDSATKADKDMLLFLAEFDEMDNDTFEMMVFHGLNDQAAEDKQPPADRLYNED